MPIRLRRIYVSWPGSPEQYAIVHHSNHQIAYHLFSGLQKRFANVIWIDWGKIPDDEITESDFFVTHPRTMMVNEVLQMEVFTKAKAKLILFGNQSLLSEKWKNGGYNLHGYKIDYFQGQEHAIPRGTGLRDLIGKQCEYACASIWKSNDVSMKKWNQSHADVSEMKNWVSERNLDWNNIPHPIDKPKFYREVFDSRRKKFLVLAGSEPNKRQHIFRQFAGEGNCVVADGVNWFDPSTYQKVIRECSFTAQISLQEGFPYFVNEAFCKGLLPICGEDFWDGYGHEELIWRQDAEGKSDGENLRKIKYLLDENIELIYQTVLEKHLSRSDNHWNFAIDLIAEKIRRYS